MRLKVGAASLNFNDIDRCRGKLVSVPTPPPYTLGVDACGVVDAAGPGCEAWLGKRVAAITKMALGGIADTPSQGRGRDGHRGGRRTGEDGSLRRARRRLWPSASPMTPITA